MIEWRITEQEKISQFSGSEPMDNLNSIKVKIDYTLLTNADFDLYHGENPDLLPIVPGSIAVGEVVEVADENNPFGLKKMDKVCINPIVKTVLFDNIEEREDIALEIAGKNVNGFLKDFVVLDGNCLFALPKSIALNDAIYIEYISICLEAISSLKIQKGETVAIVGGNILGNILAQLINYYQGVPIVIDNNEKYLSTAEKCGIYYTFKYSEENRKQIFSVTGGRMAHKVVYVADTTLPFDIALKIASQNADVAYIGFGTSNKKISTKLAMQKQISISFINDGFGNTDSSINAIINNAIDLKNFDIDYVKFNDVDKFIKEIDKSEHKENNFIVKAE